MNPAHALTLLSAASALTGLLALVAVRGPLGGAVAVTCAALSMLLDRVDGAVARRLGLVSPMGAQLDTLADLLAFGALPAALLVARHPSVGFGLAALSYGLGAVWRLARYEEGELLVGRWGEAFKGVPSSAGAAAVVVVVTVATVTGCAAWAELVTALAMAALMPSSVRYPKRGVGAWPWMVLVPLAVIAQWARVLTHP